MNDSNKKNQNKFPDISDHDIYQAMEEIPGYVDITLDDFKEIYSHAYNHAYGKISLKQSKDKPASTSPKTGDKTPEAASSTNNRSLLKNYFLKMKGTEISPPVVGIAEIGWSWIGAFLGIAAVAYCNFTLLAKTDSIMLIGSFGASAVLIYGAIKSPLAQPRNFIGGHLISAVIGVASYQFLSFSPWLASAVAVATAIAVMHATKTLHPPGGATALIAVIGSQKIHALGYLYVLAPVGIGACIMLIVALVVNNIPKSRKYPEFWL
jgi:CBS-domain-containing membrane protein